MMRALRALTLGGAAVALLSPGAAFAQTQPDSAQVVSRVCREWAGHEVSEAKLAEALLIEAGVPAERFLEGTLVQPSAHGQPLVEVLNAALVAQMGSVRADPNGGGAIGGGIRDLEQFLADNPRKIVVERTNDQPVRLFSGSAPLRMTCAPQPQESIERDPDPSPSFAIRETPEELWLPGDEGRKAGAFTLGFERTRTTLENGTRKAETSLTIDGTIGIRLTRAADTDFPVYAFATYNLERNRTRPRPQLGPGESESDDDTDALALGLNARLQTFVGDLPIDGNLQTSAVFDFANNARRIRAHMLVTPGWDQNIGLCTIGSFSEGTLRRRCRFSAEVEASRILQRGTTELGTYDTFFAIGGRGGIEFFLPTTSDNETGFLASINYRLLSAIHGPQDIERFEAKLAHRFWTGVGVGIDVGFTYVNGTNELTFDHENKLTLGAGLIF